MVKHVQCNAKVNYIFVFFFFFIRRKIIIDGCVAFAKHVGGTRIEAELLPQCWEQVKINNFVYLKTKIPIFSLSV